MMFYVESFNPKPKMVQKLHLFSHRVMRELGYRDSDMAQKQNLDFNKQERRLLLEACLPEC